MRVDLFFSSWIFLWYVVYQIKWVPFSPELVLWVALLFELWILAYCFRYGYPMLYIFYFALMQVAIKVIPLWTLYGKRPLYISDLLFGVGLGVVYLAWLAYNKTTATKVYASVINLIRAHKPLPVEQSFVNLLKLGQ
jgi:hypothetical protein